MKLTVLTENCAGGYCAAEHGLSYLIESNGKSILFDTGHSDLFLRNAAILGIDVEKLIDIVVLSHGHWDHGDGLRFLSQKRLIAHPNIFMKRFRAGNSKNIGLALTKHEIIERFRFFASAKAFFVTENIVFLGEIPRLNDFESQTTPFVDEVGLPDFVIDDSALAIIENKQLIIISGCAHSGICNIIEYAKAVTSISKVHAVVGGFHLKFQNKQTIKTVEYFKEQQIEYIFPSHCTELAAMAVFTQNFEIEQLKTGSILSL